MLWGTGQFAKGADAYARSIALGTDRPLAVALQADCLLFAGRYEDALQLFAAYNASHADGDGEYRLKEIAARAIVKRLGIPQQRRRTQRALNEAKGVPGTPEGWHDQALAQLRVDALWGSAWFNLGVSDRDYGDPRDALASFIASTILVPADLEAWQNAIVMAFALEAETVLADLIVTGNRMAGDDLIRLLLEVTKDAGAFPRDRFIAKLDAILAAHSRPTTGGFTVRIIGDGSRVEEVIVGRDGIRPRDSS